MSLPKFLEKLQGQSLNNHCIAVASYVRTKPKPKRELRRVAPQLSFGFYVLTKMAIAINKQKYEITSILQLHLAR